MIPALSPSKVGRGERWLIGGILAAALVHGLIYVFIMPPWQHYEEPSHFEYAWLIATERRLPPDGAYDEAIRRELAASMIEHDFFRDLDFVPNPNTTSGPAWIGQSVVGGVPLYHILVSVPLTLSRPLGLLGQLYAARIFSLGMFVATVALSYLIVSELTGPGHMLRWAVPSALALLPGFADLMTALSNDVGATFFFSLFLWAAVRLICRGFSGWRLAALALTALLCAATKNTVLVAVPLGVLAVGGAFFRTSLRPLRWALPLLAALLVFGLFSMLSWGDAALWHRSAIQAQPTRTGMDNAPVGAYAIRLSVPPGSDSAQLRQLIPVDQLASFQGRTATLGAWMWASTPLQIAPLRVSAGAETLLESIELGTQPAFHAFQVSVPAQIERLDIVLNANRQAPDDQELAVFFDGLVFLPGDWPLTAPPVFLDTTAGAGSWGGRSFSNAIRNASGERGWLSVRPWAEGLFRAVAEAHLSPNRLLSSIQDWQVTRQLYVFTSWNLFQTFWARFGWGQVFLPEIWYWLLAAATVVAAGLSLPVFWVRFRQAERPIKIALLWLGLAGLSIWLSALLRGFFTVPLSRLYLPTARYTYPAVTPTLLLLSAGAMSLLGLVRRFGGALFIGGFLILDLVSLLTIYQYYR